MNINDTKKKHDLTVFSNFRSFFTLCQHLNGPEFRNNPIAALISFLDITRIFNFPLINHLGFKFCYVYRFVLIQKFVLSTIEALN